MGHPIKHFLTIVRHRHMVIYHCFKTGIFWQGLKHDLSKFSPTEFSEGSRFFLGNKSPNEAERRERGYSNAWMHHKGRNKHHFEYWTDYSFKTKMLEPVKMPLKYVKEMFCDRVAAGKIYNGRNYTNDNPIEYFMQSRAKSAMHPDTARLLESWLRMIQTDGEEKTFSHIKRFKNENY